MVLAEPLAVWSGETPSVGENVRRIVSAVPKPQRLAIASTVSDVVSSARRAASTRTGRRTAPGVIRPRLKARMKWRSLMPTRAGEAAHAVVGARFGVDQILRLADRAPAGALGPDRCGELRLAAGRRRNITSQRATSLGDLGRVVILDERKRQVDPGGHARRRPEPAVAAIDRLRVDDQAGELALQGARPCPVGRDPPAIRETGGGDDERSGTDGDDALGPLRQLPDSGHESRITGCGAGAEAPRNDERVQPLGPVADRRCGHAERRLGDDRPAVGRDQRQVIAGPVRLETVEHPVGGVEDLPRPDEIKTLNAVVTGEDDLDRLGGVRHGSNRGACKVLASMTHTPRFQPIGRPEPGRGRGAGAPPPRPLSDLATRAVSWQSCRSRRGDGRHVVVVGQRVTVRSQPVRRQLGPLTLLVTFTAGSDDVQPPATPSCPPGSRG